MPDHAGFQRHRAAHDDRPCADPAHDIAGDDPAHHHDTDPAGDGVLIPQEESTTSNGS